MIYGKDKIQTLRLDVQNKFVEALTDLDLLPFDVFIVETKRSILIQISYFAQGRVSLEEVNQIRLAAGLWPTKSESIITYADGITNRSKHQEGTAIDIVPFQPAGNKILWNADEGTWLQLGAVARKHGFVWGGDWKKHPAAVLGWDCPHWEMKEV